MEVEEGEETEEGRLRENNEEDREDPCDCNLDSTRTVGVSFGKKSRPPKKRVFFYSGFVACLTFVMFFAHLTTTFFLRLADNRPFWLQYLPSLLNSTTCSSVENRGEEKRDEK